MQQLSKQVHHRPLPYTSPHQINLHRNFNELATRIYTSALEMQLAAAPQLPCSKCYHIPSLTYYSKTTAIPNNSNHIHISLPPNRQLTPSCMLHDETNDQQVTCRLVIHLHGQIASQGTSQPTVI
jgi:hypothetical protein